MEQLEPVPGILLAQISLDTLQLLDLNLGQLQERSLSLSVHVRTHFFYQIKVAQLLWIG